MKFKSVAKRIFDLWCSVFAIVLLFVPGVILIIIAALETKQSGVFRQIRIGLNGKPFVIYKLRTLKSAAGDSGRFGKFMRKYKVDELLQFVNVLKGDMSVVGPRPDIPEVINLLNAAERQMLSVKPGLTSPASLKYFNEEYMLKQHHDPDTYYNEVIWPDKIKLNIAYALDWTFYGDLRILFKTIARILKIN